jgi:hypothetical protein
MTKTLKTSKVLGFFMCCAAFGSVAAGLLTDWSFAGQLVGSFASCCFAGFMLSELD